MEGSLLSHAWFLELVYWVRWGWASEPGPFVRYRWLEDWNHQREDLDPNSQRWLSHSTQALWDCRSQEFWPLSHQAKPCVRNETRNQDHPQFTLDAIRWAYKNDSGATTLPALGPWNPCWRVSNWPQQHHPRLNRHTSVRLRPHHPNAS